MLGVVEGIEGQIPHWASLRELIRRMLLEQDLDAFLDMIGHLVLDDLDDVAREVRQHTALPPGTPYLNPADTYTAEEYAMHECAKFGRHVFDLLDWLSRWASVMRADINAEREHGEEHLKTMLRRFRDEPITTQMPVGQQTFVNFLNLVELDNPWRRVLWVLFEFLWNLKDIVLQLVLKMLRLADSLQLESRELEDRLW